MMRSRICAVGCILLAVAMVLVSESSLFDIYPALGASGPQILLITRTPLDPPPGLSVNVTCLILDKYGLVNVSLFFSINNATLQTVKMQIIDGDFYNGTFLSQISTQSLDTRIEYYIVATDSIGYHVRSSNEYFRVSYDKTAPAFLSVTRIKPSGDPVLPGEPVEIQALVADNGSGVKNATLWFGESQDPYEANFSAVAMNRVSGDDWNCTYLGTIPGNPNGTRILYYVSATDYSNNTARQNEHTPYYISLVTTSYLILTINVLNVDMNNLTATVNITLDGSLPSKNEPDSIPVSIQNWYSYWTDNGTRYELADSPLFVQINSSSTRFSYHGTINWNVHLTGSPNNYPFDSYYLNLTCTVDWSQPSRILDDAYFGDFRLYNVWGTQPAFQWYNRTNEYGMPITVSTLTLVRSSASVLPLTLLIQVLFFLLGGTMLVDPTEILNERINVFLAILIFSAGFFFSLNLVVPYRLGFTVGEYLILSAVVGSGVFTLFTFLSRALKLRCGGHQQIIGIVMDGIAALFLTWWLSRMFSDVPSGYWTLLVVALWYGLTIRVMVSKLNFASAKGFYTRLKSKFIMEEHGSVSVTERMTRINDRIGKLDSLLLWTASLASLGFSLFIAYLQMPIAPFIPIFFLIGISILVGYVGGAIFSDSLTDRMRGWNYLLLGLSVYVPAAVIKFGEPFFKTIYANYSGIYPYLEMSLGLLVPIIYILLSQRVVIPRIYASFDATMGKITNRILVRAYSASICFGCLLYVLVLALYELKTDLLSITLYALFFALFLELMISEEIQVRRLRQMEKFQQFVKVESIINRRLLRTSLTLTVIGTAAFIIFWGFSGSLPIYLSVLFFLLAFTLPIFGLVFITAFAYKGDTVQLDGQSATGLSETQLTELTNLVNEMNSHTSERQKNENKGT